MIADLFIKILNLSIGAVPIMAALLVLRLLFKKAVPRKVFYIAWVLVFLRLMVPFSLESNFSFFNFMPRAEVVEENIGTSVIFIENSGTKVDFPVLNHPSADNPNTDAPDLTESDTESEKPYAPVVSVAKIDKNHIYGTVWIFGTAGLLLFGIIGYFAVLKKTNFESVPYTKNIRLSDFFKTPIVCGLFRPKIILPMNFDLDDEAKVESVIAHECTHIRRGDNFWRLLASFTLYVHWFNPLVWICYDAFIRDMEVSCDEEVLAKAKKDIRAEYAESLVALSGSGTNPLYGGVLSFGESGIKERVKCIMNFKKATVFILIICAMAALALGVIFLTNPSAIDENANEVSYAAYETYETENSKAVYSQENGLEIEVFIKNTDNKTIWLGPATYIYSGSRDNGTFVGVYGNGGVLMIPKGDEALFCDTIPAEKFHESMRYNLQAGEYMLSREVYFDEELSPTGLYADFSFEIKYVESKAIFSNDFSGKIVSGEVANKFVPSKDFSDEQVLAASNKALHYSNFINNICSGMEGPGIKEITLIVQPNDKDYVVEMDKETAKSLMSMIGKIEIKSTTKNVNPNTGGLIEIYINTEGSLVRIQYDGRLIITGEAYENASVFDGEVCEDIFADIRNLAENMLAGAEEYCEPEMNPAIGYDLYAAIYSGEVPEGKYIPSASVLPKEVVWADNEQRKYCKKLIEDIDIDFASAFIVGNTGDESTRVGISKMEAFGLLSILQETQLFVSEPTNPNTPAAKEIHIVMQSGDYIKIVWNTSYFTLYHKGDEVAYRFDASRMKDFFTKFSNAADRLFIQGAGTQAQYPNDPANDWTGTNYVIPMNVETVATIFNNKEKTAVEASSSTNDLFRSLLTRRNFEKQLDEESMEELGEALSGIDAIEFARTEDGKKYTFYLYENGFVLTGSAVPENEKNQAWIVKGNPWMSIIETAEIAFSESDEIVPYWFGLINRKNVSNIYVQDNEGNGNNIMPEDDCFRELIERLRRFKISGSVERFSGNGLSAPDEEYVEIVITFNTGTVYNLIFTRNSVGMVSDDMNYGLNYKSAIDGYDEFLDFAMEGGLQNPMTGKPVIYLYPEKETEVSVKLDFDGKLTYTYPALNNGWRVLAKPDGTLTNLADGSTHYYLFWEGTARPKWTYEKGFVVKGSETESFLRENLAKMGLTPREYNDFITYWVPKMQENPYNLISFSGDEYSEIAKLTVNPKPDSVIRIHMMWKALDEPIEIELQVLPTYERKGFTLVEWGGTELY